MNRITIALAGALALALLVIAFLLGRQSVPLPARGPATAVAVPAPAAGAAGVGVGEPVAPLAEPLDPSEPRLITNEAGEVLIANRPSPNTGEPKTEVAKEAAKPARAVEAPKEQADVEAYFQRLAALEAGPAGADQQSFAQELIGAVMKGNYSGFDQLAKDLEDAQRQVQSLVPPPSCRTFQQRLLEHMAESKALMTSLREAIATKNLDALAELGQRASKLQRQMDELKALEKGLRGSS